MAFPASAAAVVVLLGLMPEVALAQAKAPAGHRASSDERAGAMMSGFETLADGSTRLFVELSKPVPYETKAVHGTVTYVLKNAHVVKRNSTNPLVTTYFNTPVTNARLVPHGHDLWFVLDLRAEVQPTVSMDASKDGGAVMHIALPKGDYLPAEQAAPESEEAPDSTGAAPSGASPAAPAASSAPATPPPAHHGSHRGSHRASPQGP
jgi:hypothetical protein